MQSGLAATGLAFANRAVMAGPFDDVNEYWKVIPHDKRLDANWIRSLFDRGEKEVYSDPRALKQIGMPVGGLFTGTVYLAGDGRLWLWDIFNRDQEGIAPRVGKQTHELRGKVRPLNTREGLNYISPAVLESPFDQGFTLQVQGKMRSLDGTGFGQVVFDGRYPTGKVTYRDEACPVEVELGAFSPFIPLNLDDSSLPAVVMSFTLTNRSDEAIAATLSGHLANPICLDSGKEMPGQRHNRIVREPGLSALVCSAAPKALKSQRPDILFEDFEKENYQGWTVEGEAFGKSPIAKGQVPQYQGDLGGEGQRVVNSHASAPGDSIGGKDGKTGKLISESFTIRRKFINLHVGGGSHQGKTCVNVVVDGNVIASVTGRDHNRMQRQSISVERFEGKTAQLEIVDNESGSWGNIGVDKIVFSDSPTASGKLTDRPDFGTMTLMLLGDASVATASTEVSEPTNAAAGTLSDPLVGRISRELRLQPGESATVTFALTWHLPNFYSRGCGNQLVGHHYATRFDSAIAVADTWPVTLNALPVRRGNGSRPGMTRRCLTGCSIARWPIRQRWPQPPATVSAMAGSGPGKGLAVAQEPARTCGITLRLRDDCFPKSSGSSASVSTSASVCTTMAASACGPASPDRTMPPTTASAGEFSGVLREHQMSADDAFLRRLWPNVRKALEFMIQHDGNADGILEGSQPNTLDAAWFGKISFISSLYLAALRAGQQWRWRWATTHSPRMCKRSPTKVQPTSSKPTTASISSSWKIQSTPTRSASATAATSTRSSAKPGRTGSVLVSCLTATNNFRRCGPCGNTTSCRTSGRSENSFTQGRWYAMAGDAGLVMCTWPKGGKRDDWEKHWQYQYFNECMSGFEYQAAAHMIWEGHDQPDLLQNGLAITRAIHDRYNGELRNPYNEIECSDHYSRAMASYGVYQAVCGYEHHGPKGHLGFAPRLTPEDFRCAFTTAAGWGTFSQQVKSESQHVELRLKWGTLRLTTLALQLPQDRNPAQVRVTVAGNDVPATLAITERRADIRLQREVRLDAGQSAEVVIALANSNRESTASNPTCC